MQQFNNDRAATEGWSISIDESEPLAMGNYRLKRLDTSRQFLSDDDAWTHVINQAMFANDVYHIAALDFIAGTNLLEFNNIAAHARLIGVNDITENFYLLRGEAA
jgi:hypothetical protein